MENSKIEWTDHTFNPWTGCTKVSDGCKNCYAEALMDKRFGTVQWGPQGTRKRTSAANWRKPVQWNRNAASFVECDTCGWRGDKSNHCPHCFGYNCSPARQRVFCASLADVFEDRPELVEWRRDLVVMMEQTPNLDWLLLTKRPENVTRMIADTITIDPAVWWESMRNVWIGASVENQEQADKRIPHLLNIPPRVRFLSMEPLLGPVDFRRVPGFNRMGLDLSGWWAIVGGESGPNARPMHPDWVRSILGQCKAAGIPFFFKQWGEWLASPQVQPRDITGDTTCMIRVGKKTAGRLLDGREWSEYPPAKK